MRRVFYCWMLQKIILSNKSGNFIAFNNSSATFVYCKITFIDTFAFLIYSNFYPSIRFHPFYLSLQLLKARCATAFPAIGLPYHFCKTTHQYLRYQYFLQTGHNHLVSFSIHRLHISRLPVVQNYSQYYSVLTKLDIPN